MQFTQMHITQVTRARKMSHLHNFLSFFATCKLSQIRIYKQLSTYSKPETVILKHVLSLIIRNSVNEQAKTLSFIIAAIRYKRSNANAYQMSFCSCFVCVKEM